MRADCTKQVPSRNPPLLTTGIELRIPPLETIGIEFACRDSFHEFTHEYYYDRDDESIHHKNTLKTFVTRYHQPPLNTLEYLI
jgi:hypothetical protein